MIDTFFEAKTQLFPVAPFNFGKTLAFLSVFGITAGEQVLADQSLTKAICMEGQPYLFHVRSIGSNAEPQLDCTFYAPQPIQAETQASLADRVSFYLGLGDDLRPFYELAEEDAPFAPILKALYGYHQVKFLTPFENACWAVLSQRAYRAEARKMKSSITERWGCGLEWQGNIYKAFPEPTRLLAADDRELLPLVGMNERKVEYLKSVAWAFANADEAFLRTGPYGEVKAWLLGIRGIGAWSSAFILIRGLGRMEELTTQERNLLQAASKVYGNGRTLDWDEVEKIAERYGPYKGYWAHYLRAAADMGNFCF